MSSVASQEFPSHWVTPDELLKQLNPENTLVIRRIQEAAQCIEAIATLVTAYLHSEALYRAGLDSLRFIGKLAPKIPPLPRMMEALLKQPCPLQICSELKPDGTPFTIGEKCVLTLVSQELGSIDAFAKIVASYEEKYPEEDTVLRIRNFVDCKEYAAKPFEPTHWELQTKGPIEGSLSALSEATGLSWQDAEFAGTIMAIILTYMGHGESIYFSRHQELDTRISATSLAIGFSRGGVNVYRVDKNSTVGSAAVVKFYG